jgi:hypothetical protein
MTAFTALASQLNQANESAAAQVSVASAASQASAAASNVAGGARKGAAWARGIFKAMVGEEELRAGLMGNGIPADGSQCQECGVRFGGFQRRGSCAACSRYLCGSCIGSPFAAATGIHCFCPATCPHCKEQSVSGGEFEACKAQLESGISVTICMTQQTVGLFTTSRERHKVPAWLSLNSSMAEFYWTSLEQKNGRPLQEVRIPVGKVLTVRNTGIAIEMSIMGQPEPTSLEFTSSSERDTWFRYIEVAVEVLMPEADRERREVARNKQRQIEMEDRRVRNEERRKELSDNLGMRFSAQAMLER